MIRARGNTAVRPPKGALAALLALAALAAGLAASSGWPGRAGAASGAPARAAGDSVAGAAAGTAVGAAATTAGAVATADTAAAPGAAGAGFADTALADGVDLAPDLFREIEPGLAYADLPALLTPAAGDGRVRVLRVDPERFELVLLCTSGTADGRSLTPREWARRFGLVAVANAPMYAQDYRTAVSLLRTRHHVNNGHLTRQMAVLACDPLERGVPPAQIIDREYQDFEALSRRYGALAQGIRMVALDGRNCWQPQARAWSAAAVGMDHEGRVLLVHVRSPYTMFDLVEMLRALPLDLRNLMYTDGGPVAQLYAGAGEWEIELTGSHGSENVAVGPVDPSPLPNVIGVRRRVPWAPPPALPPVGAPLRPVAD